MEAHSTDHFLFLDDGDLLVQLRSLHRRLLAGRTGTNDNEVTIPDPAFTHLAVHGGIPRFPWSRDVSGCERPASRGDECMRSMETGNPLASCRNCRIDPPLPFLGGRTIMRVGWRR